MSRIMRGRFGHRHDPLPPPPWIASLERAAGETIAIVLLAALAGVGVTVLLAAIGRALLHV